MKLVKFEQSQEFRNGEKCTVVEYPLDDKDINFSSFLIYLPSNYVSSIERQNKNLRYHIGS